MRSPADAQHSASAAAQRPAPAARAGTPVTRRGPPPPPPPLPLRPPLRRCLVDWSGRQLSSLSGAA
eukprot:356703-Chlamydomonas_euryale.AAC.4